MDKHHWGGKEGTDLGPHEWMDSCLGVELGHVSQLSREKDLIKETPWKPGALGGVF